MADLAYMPLIEVANLLEKRQLSPVELARHLLDCIDRADKHLHSYRTVLADRALAQARRAEEEIASGAYRGRLHGIPIAVKDLVYTAGIPTLCGSTLMEGWRPAYDATVLRRLDAVGAVLLGKMAGLFAEIDLLACPAMPFAAPPIGDDALPLPDDNVVRPRFTYPFNFSNSPTLTLPCGFTADGLPLALQLVGPHFGEETLLRVGHAFEQSTVWHTRIPLVD
jgi:Asp-tRNA(Asn)/Glu-tRNA(Gln) amidotransferase A subunit family amidase